MIPSSICERHVLSVVRWPDGETKLSSRLKPELEHLSRLARQTGRTQTFYATKLVEENIEDLEGRYLTPSANR
jgi:predicted DNA-binding protein